MSLRFFLAIGFLALIIYFVGFRYDHPSLEILSAGKTFKIHFEVAQTEEEKRVGLMGRKDLPEGYGMLFIYDTQQNPVMWMKDMLIPLDIIFISPDLTINHIQKEVSPCESSHSNQCNRYSSEAASLYVLELAAGYTEKRGIKKGDQIFLPLGF